MKVLLIFREDRSGGFSIEAIFNSLIPLFKQSIEVEIFKVDGTISKFQNIKNLSKQKADIYHITGDCNYLAIGLPAAKTILTVHDIGHYEISLSGLKKLVYGLFWWYLPLNRVAHITTVSNFTKQRIVKTFNLSFKKVTRIYNPLFNGFHFKNKIFNSDNPRIMQIGSSPNKNLGNLVKSVVGIPCTLVLVGMLSTEFESLLKQYSIKYEVHNNLSIDQLQNLFQTIDILFFASTYEGFGLPIIEAQACGIAVITSNICSMPEIAGKGALLVNPYDIGEIQDAFLSILSNQDLRNELIKYGLENVEAFNLKTISQQYLHLYEKLGKHA